MFCRLQSILSEGVPSPLSRTQRGPAQHPKQDGFESYEKKKILGALCILKVPFNDQCVCCCVSCSRCVAEKTISTQIWQNICGCTKAKLIGVFRNTRRHLVLSVRTAVLLAMGHLPIGCFADDKTFCIVIL